MELPPSPSPATLLLAAVIVLLASGAGASFNCTGSTPRCAAAVEYVPPSATTYASIAALFQVSLASLLATNNLASSTPAMSPVSTDQRLRLTFPCLCSGGIGWSDHVPTYTVAAGDTLYNIATKNFSQLLAYQDIATANKLPDANKITVGQKLWIPLPCSCDAVDGEVVIHDAYIVQSGNTVAYIASLFGVSNSTLMNLNGITDPKSLKEDQILDVPLQACNSSISAGSPDHNLTLADGMNAVTADGCVICSCTIAKSSMLSCTLVANKSGCPAATCNGNATLGAQSVSGCAVTACEYTGYSNSSTGTLQILTQSITNTQNCSNGKSNSWRSATSVWSATLVAVYVSLFMALFAG